MDSSPFTDIDECLANPCGYNANCTNTNGSYFCECQTGYEGNGTNCTGKTWLSMSIFPQAFWATWFIIVSIFFIKLCAVFFFPHLFGWVPNICFQAYPENPQKCFIFFFDYLKAFKQSFENHIKNKKLPFTRRWRDFGITLCGSTLSGSVLFSVQGAYVFMFINDNYLKSFY